MRDLVVAAETTTSKTCSEAMLYQQHQHQSSPMSPPRPPVFGNSPSLVLDEFHKTYYLNCMQEAHNNSRRKVTAHQSPRKPKKRVTFAADAYLYPGDLTVDEVKSSWYKMEDFRRFKDDRKESVRRMRRNEFSIEQLEQQGFCLRGLEPYFSLETNRAMKYSRELSFRMVMEEQERQRNMGIANAHDLRNQACIATEWARDVALELGSRDAQEARRVHAFVPPPQHSPIRSSVTHGSRAEFIRTSAVQRRESNRKMRVDDHTGRQQQLEEDRYAELLRKKLESALSFTEKADNAADNNVNTSNDSEINPAA